MPILPRGDLRPVLSSHIAGKCSKHPDFADAGGDAASNKSMPACLGNKGKVTSAIEVTAFYFKLFMTHFYDNEGKIRENL